MYKVYTYSWDTDTLERVLEGVSFSVANRYARLKMQLALNTNNGISDVMVLDSAHEAIVHYNKDSTFGKSQMFETTVR